MRVYNTPLRYPGGKGKLAKFVARLFELNDLCDGHYAEPYAGGAGVAFELLFSEYASHVHLNDISLPIYAFWDSVLNRTDELCKLINDTPLSVEEWNRQREIQQRPSRVSRLNLGFSMFYLNRTNRSGIVNGGVIGGKAQDGKWKIDARFNKAELVNRIQKIALFKDRISVHNLDAEEFVRKELKKLPSKSLVYLDPPYFIKGQGLYEDHYTADDHERVANLVKKELRDRYWMVTYDNVPEIRKFYSGQKMLEYGLIYSAREYYVGSELMVFSKHLTVPAEAGHLLRRAA